MPTSWKNQILFCFSQCYGSKYIESDPGSIWIPETILILNRWVSVKKHFDFNPSLLVSVR
jgi:hypothetical protein